jgi:ABC-type multidrug transport system fused ATPase/permease subunit
MFGGGGMGGMGGGGMGGRVGGGAGGAGPMAGMHGALMRSTDLTDEVIFGKIYDHKVVTRLMVYLKDHKARVALAFFAMLISTLTSLFMPLLLSDAINVVTGNANKIDTIAKHLLQLFNVQGTSNIILALFLIFIANGLLNWGSQYLQIYTMSNIGRKVLLTLRIQMFDHLQKLSLSFYDRNEVGRIMSRVQNDVASLQEILSNGVLEIFADFLSLGVIIFIIFTMNAQLSLITMTIIPVLLIVMIVWQNYAKVAFMRVRQAISVVNADLQENISGARVIQSLSRENINFQRFDNLNESNFDANLQATRLAAGLQPVIELLTGAATALVIIYGGAQAIAGNLLLGSMVGFVLYVQRFFDPIRSLSMQYTELQRAMAGGQRIFEVLDTKIEVIDAPDAIELPPIKGNIHYDNVSFSYIKGTEVVGDINLHIQQGETIAFVGATGAGKSTMVALVCRFYEVSSGSLSIDGYDVRKVTQESLRRQIGVVLQEPFLFSGTIRENIMYGREDATEEKMIEAAKAVGAHDFIMRLENGYDTILHERGSNMSQGQRQLISFARAILADPRILILDEATANIDTQTEIVIQQALKKLLQGRTSLVIAHRLSTIHDADRVVVMENGKIVEIGNHQELIEKRGIYHHLYTMSYAYTDEKTSPPEKRRPT